MSPDSLFRTLLRRHYFVSATGMKFIPIQVVQNTENFVVLSDSVFTPLSEHSFFNVVFRFFVTQN